MSKQEEFLKDWMDKTSGMSKGVMLTQSQVLEVLESYATTTNVPTEEQIEKLAIERYPVEMVKYEDGCPDRDCRANQRSQFKNDTKWALSRISEPKDKEEKEWVIAKEEQPLETGYYDTITTHGKKQHTLFDNKHWNIRVFEDQKPVAKWMRY